MSAKPEQTPSGATGGKVAVVKLEFPRFDSRVASNVRDLMSNAWNTGARYVALDFSAVTYIDSLGISVLISEQRKRPDGGKILLCALTDYVRDVFEVTQLLRVFDVYASTAAAVSANAG